MAYTAILKSNKSRAGRLFTTVELARQNAQAKTDKAKNMGLALEYGVGKAEPVNKHDIVHNRL